MSNGPIDSREYYEEEYRKSGFEDAMNGLYHPEMYAKGWARDAYREGKDDYMNSRGDEGG